MVTIANITLLGSTSVNVCEREREKKVKALFNITTLCINNMIFESGRKLW